MPAKSAVGDLESFESGDSDDLERAVHLVLARKIGFQDVPLLCATEVAVPHAMPRVVRLMMHVETTQPRSGIQHVYLRGAKALRLDIAQ